MSDASDPNLVPDPPVPEPVEPEPAPAPEPEPVEPAPEPAAKGGIPQERLDSYARRTREAEARAARLERIAEALLAQAPAARDAAPEPPAPSIDPLPPRPRRENFNDPDAYDEALDEWQDKKYARQRAIERAEDEQHRKALTEQQQREAARRDQEAELQRISESWQAQVAKAELEEPEWFEAIDTVGKGMYPTVAEAIQQSDLATQLVMHLYKNPEVRDRLHSLKTVGAVFREVGKLEAQLTRPEPVVAPQRTAPPMRPVGQRSAGSIDRDIHDIGNQAGTMNEYAAKRLEQMAAARRQH